jgi:hypothetical protein
MSESLAAESSGVEPHPPRGESAMFQVAAVNRTAILSMRPPSTVYHAHHKQ